jgi:ferredoxin
MDIDFFCFYCGTCANVCPKMAIELLDTGVVEINADCEQHVHNEKRCGICIKACPVGAIHGL